VKAATTRKHHELRPKSFALTTRLKPCPTDAFSIAARKSHAPTITGSAPTMGKTNPGGRAIRTFCRGVHSGFQVNGRNEQQTAHTVIFSSLPISLSRNQSNITSFINVPEESV
jgi:hypothetical protein